MVMVKSSVSKVFKGFHRIMVLTDYEEIYLPVAQLSSIRTLLAFAAEKKLQDYQMYIVSAFFKW